MDIIGSQISYVSRVLEAKGRVFDAGLDAQEVENRAKLAADYAKILMQIVVSLLVLIAGLVLLFRSPEPTQKLAGGLIGTVVGYWLR